MKRLGAALLCAMALCAPALAAGYDDLNGGIQLFNRYEPAAALPYFDRAIASGELTDGLKFIAHFDRALTHLGLGNREKAIEDLSASLALRPGDAMALSSRARAYLAARKYELAIADLDRIIADRPSLPDLYLDRAALHALQGRKEEGLRDLTQAGKAMEELGPIANFSLGLAHWQLDRHAEAEEQFSESLPERGTYGWLWLSLARSAQGKAISRSRLSLPSANAWPTPIVNFLLGQESMEAVMTAAATASNASVRHGQVCEANFYLGTVLGHRGDTAAAGMIRKAAETCPTAFVEWLPAQIAAAKAP